jgi:hypothetical protein
MNLDGWLVGFFVFVLLAWVMLGIVDRVFGGSGRVFALLGNLIKDVRLGLLLGRVMGHDELDLGRVVVGVDL